MLMDHSLDEGIVDKTILWWLIDGFSEGICTDL